MSPDLPGWLKRSISASNPSKNNNNRREPESAHDKTLSIVGEVERHLIIWNKLDLDNILEDIKTFSGGDFITAKSIHFGGFDIHIPDDGSIVQQGIHYIYHPHKFPDLLTAITSGAEEHQGAKFGGITKAVCERTLPSMPGEEGSHSLTSQVFYIFLDPRDNITVGGKIVPEETGNLGRVKSSDELKDRLDILISKKLQHQSHKINPIFHHPEHN